MIVSDGVGCCGSRVGDFDPSKYVEKGLSGILDGLGQISWGALSPQEQAVASQQGYGPNSDFTIAQIQGFDSVITPSAVTSPSEIQAIALQQAAETAGAGSPTATVQSAIQSAVQNNPIPAPVVTFPSGSGLRNALNQGGATFFRGSQPNAPVTLPSTASATTSTAAQIAQLATATTGTVATPIAATTTDYTSYFLIGGLALLALAFLGGGGNK